MRWYRAMWARAARPPGLIQQTRWLFGLCCLIALVVTLPGLRIGHSPTTERFGLLAAGVLAVLWLFRYLTGRTHVVLDAAEALAVLIFALGCPNPVTAFGFAISAMWFRAVYGSTRQVAVHGVLMAAGLAAAIPLWTVVADTGPTLAGPLIGTLPILVITVVVARHLALGLFSRERSQRRDAALADLGNQLLGTPDRDEIFRHGWEASVAICATTPGLSMLSTVDSGQRLEVVQLAGHLRDPGASLNRSVLPSPETDGRAFVGGLQPVGNPGVLAEWSDAGTEWLIVAMLEPADMWLIVGFPAAGRAEAKVAIQSMLNQLSLAVGNSRARRALDTQANTDALTGLGNRAAFNVALGVAHRNADATLSVLFVDLDDFKTVNDGLGHAAGDELLCQIAGRLSNALRPEDYCARLGGDEFAILIRDAAYGAAEIIGQRLVDLITAPVMLAGRAAHVGASIGLAHRGQSSSPELLVKQADIAMYAAKAKGKNRLQTYDPSLLQAEAQAAVEADCRAAAEAEQLAPYCQPVIPVPGGEPAVVEALVR